MDAHVLNTDARGNSTMGTCAILNNENGVIPSEIKLATAVVDSSSREQIGPVVEPRVGMEFNTMDEAYNFYEDYVKRAGLATKLPLFNPGTEITADFLCPQAGPKRKSGDGCDAMLRVAMKGERWVVTRFVKEHNHSNVTPTKLQYIRPKVQGAWSAKNTTIPKTSLVSRAAAPVDIIVHAPQDWNHPSRETDHNVMGTFPIESNHQMKSMNLVNNAVRHAVEKKISGKDAQNMLDYFRKMQAGNPGFFYAIQLDGNSKITNAFWADSRSRTAYSSFGDVVILDTSYKMNHYQVPFAPITGVNHHGQNVPFGCALLQDGSEASFIWLFKSFLTAMNDRAPVSIITNQGKAIKDAIVQVFPRARHCINRWDVLKEGEERLLHVCLAHPNFQVELYNCINLTETIEEFEYSWASIIEKYGLGSNDWLQSVYDKRKLWVPVYFRDSFFAALSPNQGFGTSLFDGYIDQSTTLPMFFRQYESAVENWFQKEMEADFDTLCTPPVPMTPSPMEKQVANVYTKKIFAKFQKELVETFIYTANRIDDGASTTTSVYRVAKFEEDHKPYLVTLTNSADLEARCSCKMFEYVGIVCRHILTVFIVTNIFILPSHFILNRWTIDAKLGVSSDENGVDSVEKQSMVSRYNSLCREVIKYAEEGSVSHDTYQTALAGLRDLGNKVDLMKNDAAKVASPSSLKDGAGHSDKSTIRNMTLLSWPGQDEVTRQLNCEGSGSMIPLLWPQQDEATSREFTFEEGSVTTPCRDADLNLPCMALQRDNGTSHGTVVLPCLKSMTWLMENKHLSPANRIAVINLKLHDYSKIPAEELEVKFQLSTVTLEPMIKSMANINEQMSSLANRVAVVNLKLQDTETAWGESEVKFQVSKDTLGAILRSMAYIREQLRAVTGLQADPPSKRLKK